MQTSQMTRARLAKLYREYVNNFITLAGFANYYGINLPLAQRVINVGRIAHNKGRK